MFEVQFAVAGVKAVPDAATPLLAIDLRISLSDPAAIVQSLALACQLRIEATQRRYERAEQDRLTDLFGEPERWGRTLHSLLWTHASVNVPAFTGSTTVALPVPCTFDFNVAATKYFHGLESGDVPLLCLFSGTMFYRAGERLQIAQIPWDKEVQFRLPVEVWRDMMNAHYPNTAWLNVRRDVFDQLLKYKSQRACPTWETVFENLLAADSAEAPP